MASEYAVWRVDTMLKGGFEGRGNFKIYFFENRAARQWKEGETLQMKPRIAESPFFNQYNGFACFFADLEEGNGKVFYFHSNMGFLTYGPVCLDNKNLQIIDGYSEKDGIKLYLPDGNIVVPELTCTAEAAVLDYEQQLMKEYGHDGYFRNCWNMFLPEIIFVQKD